MNGDQCAIGTNYLERSRYGYARQCLWEALSSLVGEGPLRKRLTQATLPLLKLRASRTCPDKMQKELIFIVDGLTKINLEYPNGDPIPRTHLSPKHANHIARKVLDLYTDAQGGL